MFDAETEVSSSLFPKINYVYFQVWMTLWGSNWWHAEIAHCYFMAINSRNSLSILQCFIWSEIDHNLKTHERRWKFKTKLSIQICKVVFRFPSIKTRLTVYSYSDLTGRFIEQIINTFAVKCIGVELLQLWLLGHRGEHILTRRVFETRKDLIFFPIEFTSTKLLILFAQINKDFAL